MLGHFSQLLWAQTAPSQAQNGVDNKLAKILETNFKGWGNFKRKRKK